MILSLYNNDIGYLQVLFRQFVHKQANSNREKCPVPKVNFLFESSRSQNFFGDAHFTKWCDELKFVVIKVWNIVLRTAVTPSLYMFPKIFGIFFAKSPLPKSFPIFQDIGMFFSFDFLARWLRLTTDLKYINCMVFQSSVTFTYDFLTNYFSKISSTR